MFRQIGGGVYRFGGASGGGPPQRAVRGPSVPVHGGSLSSATDGPRLGTGLPLSPRRYPLARQTHAANATDQSCVRKNSSSKEATDCSGFRRLDGEHRFAVGRRAFSAFCQQHERRAVHGLEQVVAFFFPHLMPLAKSGKMSFARPFRACRPRDSPCPKACTATHTRRLGDSSVFSLTVRQEWVRIWVRCEGEFDAGDS